LVAHWITLLQPVRVFCRRDEFSWRGPLACSVGFRADVLRESAPVGQTIAFCGLSPLPRPGATLTNGDDTGCGSAAAWGRPAFIGPSPGTRPCPLVLVFRQSRSRWIAPGLTDRCLQFFSRTDPAIGWQTTRNAGLPRSVPLRLDPETLDNGQIPYRLRPVPGRGGFLAREDWFRWHRLQPVSGSKRPEVVK